MATFSKTAYYEKKMLNHTFSKETYTPPDQLYLALLTADPGRDGSAVSEISDPAYERQPISCTAAADDPVSGSYVANTLGIDYPQATTDWGKIGYGMIMDAKTGGNGLYKGAFDVAKEVLANDLYEVPAGQVRVVED